MKFSAGYILGGGTVIALGAAFIAGGIGMFLSLEKVEDTKNKQLQDLQEKNVRDLARDILKTKRS